MANHEAWVLYDSGVDYPANARPIVHGCMKQKKLQLLVVSIAPSQINRNSVYTNID